MQRRADTLGDGAMIAATAKHHHLAAVTRTTIGFAQFRVPLLNPFE